MAAYTTIDDPSAHFKVQLYTGNGSGGHAITFDDTDTNMQPDLVWIKTRSNSSNHQMHNSLTSETYHYLRPNSDVAEITSNSDALTAFGSDGFTIGSDGVINENTYTYVAWCWKAGGSSSSNGDGSLTSTISANATNGFSICKWTGTGSALTVGHGLGAAPELIMMKTLEETNNWLVYHHKKSSNPETDYLYLDTNAAIADYSVWNDTSPTSSVFSVGAWTGNDDGGDMIAYCFKSIQGFSKFGSYTGNGNANGPFIYLGFRPAFVLIKKVNATADWQNIDNKRGDGNGNEAHRLLWASEDDAESADYPQDLLSNGFKFYHGGEGNHRNESGQLYIYCAWAEQPFVNSNGVPCNAR